jgi:acylphosphatase
VVPGAAGAAPIAGRRRATRRLGDFAIIRGAADGRAMVVCRRYLIRGRVQRVGFRYFVQDAAHREGVSGLVRNLPDGRVEVIAEGDADAMFRLEWSIRRGPAGARVDDVDTEFLEPSGRFLGFSVRA